MGRRRRFKLERPKAEKKTNKAPQWIELPRDVTANILQRLDAFDILQNAQKVCTTWWTVCQDPIMWRVISLKYPSDLQQPYYNHRLMCYHLVDRSQGNLVDVRIDFYGDNETLHYIAERSSHLRRLTLVNCFALSGRGLSEAVKKFTQLEELHLINVKVEASDVENIGNSCPMLKSFTLNGRMRRSISEEELDDFNMNGHAVAIGKSMPNMCHLQLFANCMKNEGLQAILDGCPKLESLDLRQCNCLDLGGDLGKKCAQQIKHLRRPIDSVDDYEWGGYQYLGHPYSHLRYRYDSHGSFGYYDSYDSYDDYTIPFDDAYFPDDDWFPDFP